MDIQIQFHKEWGITFPAYSNRRIYEGEKKIWEQNVEGVFEKAKSMTCLEWLVKFIIYLWDRHHPKNIKQLAQLTMIIKRKWEIPDDFWDEAKKKLSSFTTDNWIDEAPCMCIKILITSGDILVAFIIFFRYI